MRKSCVLIFSVAMSVCAVAQPELKFRPDGKFVIMQMTDLHWTRERDDRMWDILKQGIQAVRPDLIMLTGDIVTDSDTRSGWEKVIAVLTQSGIPWAVTFGNHDKEHDMTKPEIVELLQTKSGNLTENGPENVSGNSNFILKIASSKTPGKTASVLYCFDTRQQEDGIDSTQIAWYRQNSRAFTAANGNKPLPGLAYLHIPLTEFKFVADSPATIGAFDEPVCDPPHNSGALSAFAEGGDVMGVFVGHDHTNNFIGIYDNICLAYGYTTLLSNSHYKTGRGARAVELTEDRRTFATWLVQLWEEPEKDKTSTFKPKAEIRNKVVYPDAFQTRSLPH
ncbi:MAG: metallophosphoesterase family protein [Tannerella sp.]|nr:metallophosphoesterase family protein [Tannerella sp.]